MKDASIYKQKLLDEKDRLEAGLETVGRRNPQNPEDWEATPGDMQVDTADKNEMADKVEEYIGRLDVEVTLENELVDVKVALKRIADGTYGKCGVCATDIDEDRLDAFPAAKTCKAHM